MSQQEAIQIDVLLELRDFLRANYWYLLKKGRFLFIIFLLVGIVYPISYYNGRRAETAEDQNPWGLLIMPALIIFLLLCTYLGAKRHLKSNKTLQEQIRYSFSKAGIDTVAESSSGHTGWSNILMAHETKSNFLLFISNNQMYTIPKRCFQSSEQIKSFKQLLFSELESRAKLKKQAITAI